MPNPFSLRTVSTALDLLRRGRFRAFKVKFLQRLYGKTSGDDLYALWREENALTEQDRARLRAEAAAMKHPPRISLLMPFVNVRESALNHCPGTMQQQVYSRWELCWAVAGRLDVELVATLASHSASDKRIKLRPGEHNGLVDSLSAALAAATGDYVAVCDPQDMLAEHALLSIARAIKANPEADVFYSDEDALDSNHYREPFLKPDWSPDYFMATLYTGRLAVFRTAAVRDAGGFRAGFDAVAEEDLLLRLLSRGARVVHVPEVLYHARAGSQSWARLAAPAAQEQARRALADHFAARSQAATVEAGPAPGTQRVRIPLVSRPKVSIIIPSRCQPPKEGGVPYVVRCVESIAQKSTYKEREILVLDRNEMPAEMEQRLKVLGVRRIPYSDSFNWSRVNNLGAAQATGSHLLFLNDDMEIITPDWLECMIEFSQQPEIGAVGAKLLFPDGRLQHAGVFVLAGHPGHPYYAAPGNAPGYFHSNIVPRNYSAVTGACLMTRADVFQKLGGFTEEFYLNYNDVDYCLKVLRAGRRVVCTPYAQLYHYESVSKVGVFREELERFWQHWPEMRQRDPFFNDHALEFAGV
jgi:O-antigen biosynthesis protein